MSKIAVAGNASGTGTLTIAAPNTNSDRTLTLPDVTATVITDSAGVLNIGSGQVYKDGSGNVGIGTSSPGVKLHVNSGATAEVLRIEATTNPLFSMFNAGTREFYIQTQSVIDVWGQANKDMRFGTNDAERVRITSAGNVGIGTTSPSGKLQVKQANTAYGLVVEASGNDAWVRFHHNDSLGIVETTYNTSAGYTPLTFKTGGTERMRIDSSGNVGIGTSSPIATQSGVDISSGGLSLIIGADNGSSTRTNAGNKSGRFAMAHYTNAEEPFAIALCDVTSTTNELSIGGGSGACNTATVVKFFTAANNTTVSGSERARIDSAGSLLVNTTAGYGKFTVQSTAGTGKVLLDNYATVPTSENVISIYADASRGYIQSYNNGYKDIAICSGGGNLLVGTTTGNARLTIKEEANLAEADSHIEIVGSGYSGFHWLDGTAYYIGQNSSIREVRIYSGAETAGVVLGAGGTSWSTFSDERLKYDIQPINDGLTKLANIRCVSYRLKDVDAEDSQKKLGVIAQDLVGVVDEVISITKKTGDETDYMSVRYTELIPVLIKAIQEQQAIIEQLQADVATLKGAA